MALFSSDLLWLFSGQMLSAAKLQVFGENCQTQEGSSQDSKMAKSPNAEEAVMEDSAGRATWASYSRSPRSLSVDSASMNGLVLPCGVILELISTTFLATEPPKILLNPFNKSYYT